MSRKSLLLAIGALAPATAACTAVTPAPVMVARVDAAMPPVPAELLSATNGKADPPFQIEAALVLAARMVHEAPAPSRAAGPAPLELARATPAPAAPIQLARAAPSRAPATPVAAAPVVVEAAAPATPSAPIRYAELATADEAAAALVATSAPVETPARTRRAAVRPRATAPVRVAAAAVPARPALAAAATRRSAARVERFALQAPRRSSPALRQNVAITRIRTLVTGWLKAIRI